MGDQETKNLLLKLKLEHLIDVFQENNITEDVLHLLNPTLICELIKEIGSRLIFLNYWKKNYELKENDGNLQNKNRKLEANDSDASTVEIPQLQLDKKQKITSTCQLRDIQLVQSIDEFMNSKTGEHIIKAHEINGYLTDSLRSDLCREILCELENKNIRLTNDAAAHLSKLIVSKFPSEVRETWYVPPVKKADSIKRKSEAAMGRLLIMWRNRRVKFSKLNKMTPNTVDSETDDVQLECTNEMKDTINWLQNNQEPWRLVIQKWKETYEIRKRDLVLDAEKTIDSITSKWTLYKHPQGYSLINEDFTFLKFNLKVDEEKFQAFMNTIMEYNKINSKDKTAVSLKNILPVLEDNPNSFVAINLMLLSHLFPPKRIIKLKKNQCFKPSIAEAKSSMIKLVPIISDLGKVREEAKTIAHADKTTIQPYIIIVGDLLSVEEIYVCIDEIVYKVPDLITALDTCFKTFHVFNLTYPLESEHLWMLLQRGFFNVRTKYDKTISYIENTLRKLETALSSRLEIEASAEVVEKHDE